MDVAAFIDSVASDLASAGLGLPAFKTRKYQRPLVVTPDVCPLLSIFPKELDPTLESTESSYENETVLTVAWMENAASSLETGQFDESKAKASLARAEAIIGRLQTYGVGIPGAPEQNDATVGKTRFGHVDGGIWATEIELRITTWS